MRLLVLGAGAQARYIINIARLLGDVEVWGLVDTFNNESIWGRQIDGVEVVGNLDVLVASSTPRNAKVIAAVANRDMKRKVVEQARRLGFEFQSVVHPSACIAVSARIGQGSLVGARVVAEPGAVIGNHVIVHAGCIIEHDCVLEDFVNLGPGVTTAGRVRIKSGAVVYTGASLVPDVTVEEDAIVGAGAVVLDNVPKGATAIGVPARFQLKEED